MLHGSNAGAAVVFRDCPLYMRFINGTPGSRAYY